MKDKKIIELCSYLFVVVMILCGCSSKSNTAEEGTILDEKEIVVEDSNEAKADKKEYDIINSQYIFEDYYYLLYIPETFREIYSGAYAIVYYNPNISEEVIVIDEKCKDIRMESIKVVGETVYYIRDYCDLWTFELEDFTGAKPLKEKLLPEGRTMFQNFEKYEEPWISWDVVIDSEEHMNDWAKYYLKDDGSEFKIEYVKTNLPKELTIEEMGKPILKENEEYVSFTGHWIPNNLDYDIMSETGGIELEIEISSSGIITGIFSTSTWRHGHIAEAVFEGEIENNIGVVTFNNDNWDHYGTITFEFYEKGIKATVEIDGIHGGIEHGYRIGYGSVNFSKRVDKN